MTQQFALPQALGTGGRILVSATDARSNQIAPVSEAAPEYAPDGAHLLSATVLGSHEESDRALAREERATLSAWYPDRPFDDPEPLRTDRIPFAEFAQPPDRITDLPDVDAPAGRYT